MFEDHPQFTPPAEDTLLWRYMDLAKFLAMLQQKGLYFSRSDRLGDPFEGSHGALSASRSTELFGGDLPKEVIDLADGDFERFREFIYVNCWHRNDYESEAMWSLYATRDRGIAICTDFDSLKRSIVDTRTVRIGEVSYMDYDKMFLSPPRAFTPFLHKRNSFAHENEVRAIVLQSDYSKADDTANSQQRQPGFYCDVDIGGLINQVVISPLAEDWLGAC